MTVVSHPEGVGDFYSRLSSLGRRILAALLQSLPTLTDPAPLVAARMRRIVPCSKITLLRHLSVGERAGLFVRAVHPQGRRHGLMIEPDKDRCLEFLDLCKMDTSLGIDTAPDRYHPPDTYRDRDDTNLPFLSAPGHRVLGLIEAACHENDTVDLFLSHLATRAGCSEITARRTVNRGAAAGYFQKSLHPRGPRFGVRLTWTEPGCQALRQALDTYHDTNDTKHDRYHDTKGDRYADSGDNPFPSGLCASSGLGRDTNGDRYQSTHHTGHDTNDTNPDRNDTNRDRYPDTKTDRYAQNGGNPYATDISTNSDTNRDTDQDRYHPPLIDRQIKNLSIYLGKRIVEPDPR